MILARKIVNPDIIGVTASTLCFIHCVATPFIFVAKACSSTCCTEAPLWWKAVDFLFLAISFIAIYYTTKTSTKNWVKYALWVTWTLLLFVILNESLRIIVNQSVNFRQTNNPVVWDVCYMSESCNWQEMMLAR